MGGCIICPSAAPASCPASSEIPAKWLETASPHFPRALPASFPSSLSPAPSHSTSTYTPPFPACPASPQSGLSMSPAARRCSHLPVRQASYTPEFPGWTLRPALCSRSPASSGFLLPFQHKALQRRCRAVPGIHAPGFSKKPLEGTVSICYNNRCEITASHLLRAECTEESERKAKNPVSRIFG